MSVYFYLVGSSPTLCLIGAVFLIKLLIETWAQHTPTWVCPGTWLLFTLVYGTGFPYVISTFAYCRKTTDIQFPYRDAVAISLYLFGSAFSLSYEVQRFLWKAREENKGKLHTVGLAALCVHPNYFGDLFTYTGWALAAGTMYSMQLTFFMIFAFDIFTIPNSDTYLAQRYPEEFPAYAAATPTLIPFVHSKTVLTILGR